MTHNVEVEVKFRFTKKLIYWYCRHVKQECYRNHIYFALITYDYTSLKKPTTLMFCFVESLKFLDSCENPALNVFEEVHLEAAEAMSMFKSLPNINVLFHIPFSDIGTQVLMNCGRIVASRSIFEYFHITIQTLLLHVLR